MICGVINDLFRNIEAMYYRDYASLSTYSNPVENVTHIVHQNPSPIK